MVKITNVKSGITPPKVVTLASRWNAATKTMTVSGRLDDLGKVAAVEVGFQYRLKPEATEFESRKWTVTPLVSRSTTGEFSAELPKLEAGQRYEFQAIVKHPLLMMSAKSQVFTIQ